MSISRAEALMMGALHEATFNGSSVTSDSSRKALSVISTLAEMCVQEEETTREWAKLEIERLILLGERLITKCQPKLAC